MGTGVVELGAGTPEEVAHLVGLLASDAAGYITRSACDIAGGGFMA